jgi:hypothetical protein
MRRAWHWVQDKVLVPVCAPSRARMQWSVDRASLVLSQAAWPEVATLLEDMDAAARTSPCQIGALRRVIQELLYPRVRMATRTRTPPPCAVLARLQAWLIAGILRTPVAVAGTGFFAALAAHEAACSHASAASTQHHETASKTRALGTDARACPVCGDRLELQFSDELNAWVYTDAVRVADAVVMHNDCCASAQQ